MIEHIHRVSKRGIYIMKFLAVYRDHFFTLCIAFSNFEFTWSSGNLDGTYLLFYRVRVYDPWSVHLPMNQTHNNIAV